MKKVERVPVLFVLGLFLILSAYAIFSFALTDPNLTLTSWSPYLDFQNGMWQRLFLNAPLLSAWYGALITALAAVFVLGLRALIRSSESKLSWKTISTAAVCLSLPLLFSYNALSHDVFNYMFNAKMVVEYQSNPHRQVALDFANDPWTRFMRNTHTPAPYGYGWTAISLTPYWLTTPIQHRFLPTWLLYRGLSLLSFGITLLVLKKVADRTQRTPNSWWLLAAFAWSPLVLIEIVSNQHNDLWMMWPAVAGLGLAAFRPTTWKWRVVGLGLLLFSISIKLATVTLLPLWVGLTFLQFAPTRIQTWLLRFWPLLASICLFLPLLTDRSQQFHPWYLVWVLVWLPLVGSVSSRGQQQLSWFEKGWTAFILALSITSLYRYLPWLNTGFFTDTVLRNQKLITWVPAVLIGGTWLLASYFRRSSRSED